MPAAVQQEVEEERLNRVNQVKIIDEIEFHVQTSKMVMNKGKPVVNQVPNFS